MAKIARPSTKLFVKSFKMPRKSMAFVGKFFTTLDAPMGAEVWGITNGKHWFRYCYLREEYAQKVLDSFGTVSEDMVRVNVCTDTTYAILAAEK